MCISLFFIVYLKGVFLIKGNLKPKPDLAPLLLRQPKTVVFEIKSPNNTNNYCS